MPRVKKVKHDVAITFMQVGSDTQLANLMVASVRKAMPDARIIQLSDMDSPEVQGIDEVIRKPYSGYLMTFRLIHLAALRGEWITLDTDIIVKKDIREVFSKPFDVALTKRTNKILDANGVNIVEIMPYNAGVMFSRNHIFWEQALESLMRMPESAHKWYGDQLAIRVMVDSDHFNLLELDCNTYNYTPSDADERKDVHVYHFKGNRKDWMTNGDY
jgi:lipopolysaccharide biosynthesis glycosyltransferase